MTNKSMRNKPMLNKLNKKTFYRKRFDDLYIILRNRICFLDYTPLTRLKEEELAAEFNISRTPLRRVLVRLETEGLLESKQGVGTIVSDVVLSQLLEAYEFRMYLASLIGQISPIKVTKKTVLLFQNILNKSINLPSSISVREFAISDFEQIQALMTLTTNKAFIRHYLRLYCLTSRIFLKRLSVDNLEYELKIQNKDFATLVEIVEMGNIQNIGYVLRSHIDRSLSRLQIYNSEK